VTWDPDDPVAWRVADACNRAVYPWMFQLNANRAEFLEEGRVDIQLVVMVVACAHHQGLAPNDFDNANGQPALRALADALAADRVLRTVVKTTIFHAAYGGRSSWSAAFDGEWADVVRAAEHLWKTQPRRYEVEK